MRGSRVLGRLVGALVVLAILGAGVGYGLYRYLLNWADEPLPGTATNLVLAPGDTLGDVGRQLMVDGRLADARMLGLYARLDGSARRIQAGEYVLPAGISPRQLLDKLVEGDVLLHEFRIREGETVAQMLARLRLVEDISHTLTATSPRTLHAELGLEGRFAEGAFFPDTYYYTAGDSDLALLRRAYDAMTQRLQDAWATRDETSVVKDPDELLVLASIIEKETGREEDRSQIAQVFHKRLNDNMLLQTDPTVIYAAGADFDGDLTRAHLRLDSPYNTYRYRGLPPTPIAMPSLASLEAAARPADGDYVYFVARGDGTTQFSRTLAEHNAAVRKYQLNR